MYLKTDEVNLYYEIRGVGKPLFLIHGAVVDAALYETGAEILSKYYQVITYDRRGNSRSREVYVPKFDITAQVRDAKALMDALRLKRVFLIGASAGAIVAQEVMKAYPDHIEHLLMYEPPLVSLLDKKEAEQTWVENIEALTEKGKINRAMLEFMLSLGETDDRRPRQPGVIDERGIGNFEHFLQNEFHVFMHYIPETGYYKEKSDTITVAVGERSGETKYVRAAIKFSEMTGCELLHFPGCHNLPGDLPLDFVNCLMGLMARCRW